MKKKEWKTGFEAWRSKDTNMIGGWEEQEWKTRLDARGTKMENRIEA